MSNPVVSEILSQFCWGAECLCHQGRASLPLNCCMQTPIFQQMKLSSYALLADMKRSASHGTEAHAEIAILSAIDYRLHRSGTLGSSIDSRGFCKVVFSTKEIQGVYHCAAATLYFWKRWNGVCKPSLRTLLTESTYTFQSASVPSTDWSLEFQFTSQLWRTPRNKVLFVFWIPL